MVVKMMRWRPWPPLLSKKFQVKLVVLRLHGIPPGSDSQPVAEVRWKGPKTALRSLRRTVRRNCTRHAEIKPVLLTEGGGEGEGEEVAADGAGVGVLEWNEEFHNVCTLTSHKDNAFHPWEISLLIFDGLNNGPRNKASILGTASLNIAEFASSAVEKENEIHITLSSSGISAEPPLSLHLALSLLELIIAPESSEIMLRPALPAPLYPNPANALSFEKDEVSALKAGLRKVKILRDFVSTGKPKKSCQEDDGSEEKCSARSEDAEYIYPFDTDSMDEDNDIQELEDVKEDSNIRRSFNYGTLAFANYLGGSFYSEMMINGEHEDWIYYSQRKSDVGRTHVEETMPSAIELSSQTSKRSILPWKRRRLGFRSPKAKGEPLLKPYGEEGGDDIDFDRRQMSSSDESLGQHKVDDDTMANYSLVFEFGDDNFAVGSWEVKEVVSRDGHMKLCTQVFFASIDQRNERAAGESACTALVAVIADWFQANREMPIKSQFDSLIREGSLEWRNLCENEAYRQCFPDKHFDLETVLQAKIRPLSVVPRKSFIGFFHPEGVDNDNSGLEFLHDAMSFDGIWDEISRAAFEGPSDGSPQLYIVSWNDHFFILKVEQEAYYIIDTLGERLFEGCNQAYILKFDENTSIRKMPSEEKAGSGEASESGNQQVQQNTGKEESLAEEPGVNESNDDDENKLVCRGKEACKEYLKSFLAAIPIRELQADIKKGITSSTLIHHRLQIEFHYTEQSKQAAVDPTT